MRLYLGLIYNDKNKLINHRSLLKVLCNPIMRTRGICIASEFDKQDNFLRYRIINCEKVPLWKGISNLRYDFQPGFKVIKKRRLL